MYNCISLSAEGTLYGPLHSEAAVLKYEQALKEIKSEGGTIECGGKVTR